MLASTLSPRSPLVHLLTPGFLTLTLISPGSNKSPAPPRPPPQDPSPPPSPATAQDGPSRRALVIIAILSGTLGGLACPIFNLLVDHLLLVAIFGPEGRSSHAVQMTNLSFSGDLTPEQLDDRAAMLGRDPRYTVFYALAALTGVLPEELLKYLPVLWLRWRRGQQDKGKQQRRRRKPLFDKAAGFRAAGAASLGFALAEGAIYVAMEYNRRRADQEPDMIVRQAVAYTLLYRIFIALPIHIALGVLSAARGEDADVGSASASAWRGALGAMAPSIAYHSLYNFILIRSKLWWVPWDTTVWLNKADICVLLVMYAHTARAWLGWRWESKRKRVGA